MVFFMKKRFQKTLPYRTWYNTMLGVNAIKESIVRRSIAAKWNRYKLQFLKALFRTLPVLSNISFFFLACFCRKILNLHRINQ